MLSPGRIMYSRFLVVLLAVGWMLVSRIGLASTYYVDANGGNDAWTGLGVAAGSGGVGPWRSLARAAQVELQPGDVLALRCDGVWHEALRIRGGGSPSAPVSIKPYGACAQGERPEVRPTTILVDWHAYSDSVYSASLDSPVSQVLVDGVVQAPARYPAQGLLYADGALAGGRKGSTGLVDTALVGAPVSALPTNGARVMVRTVGWKIESVGLASATGNRLRFTQATEYPVRKGSGYYLEGARWMVDDAPGWFLDGAGQQFYLHLPLGANPAGRTVEVAGAEPGLRLTRQSHVVVEGLRIRGAGADGIRVEGGNGIVLRDMEVLQSGRDGIAGTDGAVLRIENSKVQASGRDGIALLQAHGSQVVGNNVDESGTIGGPRNVYAAINAGRSSYVRIERNSIRGAGYIGIRFGSHTQVVNNAVRDACLVLDDCGAIYTWTNAERVLALSSVVRGNVIENVVGNHDGNPEPWTLAAGIYLDDLTNGVLVEGNTIRAAERGIYLHNAFDNSVVQNTVFGNRAYSLFLASDHRAYPLSGLRANMIGSNIVVALGGVPFVYYLDRLGRDFIDLLDQNLYLGTDPRSAFVVHRQGRAGDSAARYSFAEFQAALGKEGLGAIRVLGTTPTLLVNESGEARDFDCPGLSSNACANAMDAAGRRIAWPVRLAPFGSLVVINN